MRTYSLYVILSLFLLSGGCSWAHAQEIGLPDHRQQILHYWAERFDGFYQDEGFPLEAADSVYLSYYEPDPRYLIQAQVELLIGEEPFQMPTYAGTSSEYIRYGLARFQIEDGPEVTLTLYRSTRLFTNPTYQDYLFVPFLDETNGDQTYGGGRYLDIAIADIQNGLLTIDFNRAYNPLCAYSGGYRCPIPPRENHLPIPILAGELNYNGPIKERPTLPVN